MALTSLGQRLRSWVMRRNGVCGCFTIQVKQRKQIEVPGTGNGMPSLVLSQCNFCLPRRPALGATMTSRLADFERSEPSESGSVAAMNPEADIRSPRSLRFGNSGLQTLL
jgi:hypothetical protein